MIIEKIARHGDELCAIRHDLHMNPELRFEEKRTSAVVARELARLGFSRPPPVSPGRASSVR